MSENAISLRQQESKWTFLTGPDKGAVQVITRPLLIIGRSSDADISIPSDPKCSRRHAQVDWTAQDGFRIHILSENNELWVNDKSVQNSLLKNGDKITIGDTDILFNTLDLSRASSPSIRKEPSIRVVHPPQPQAQQLQPQPAVQPQLYQTEAANYARPMGPRGQKQKSSVKGMVIAIAVIGLFFVWLLTGNNAKKKKEVTIRTDEQIAQDIEAAKNLADAAEKMRQQRSLSNSYEINHAQENYVKGFRDFRKGQYERALESFQACLALNPEHVLCNRYLRLSQRKFSELIEYHMVLGRQYRDQNQYYACRTAFQNVLTMVKDQSSPKYKEAKANFEVCNRFIEGRF